MIVLFSKRADAKQILEWQAILKSLEIAGI